MKRPIILNQKGSIISETLIELRDEDRQKEPFRFRLNLKKIGQLMAFEMSKHLNYRRAEIKTSLGFSIEYTCSDDIVIISILRAAAAMTEGFAEMFPKAELGMIGAMRKESAAIEIDLSYVAIPEITDKRIIIVDPMLATGKSMVKTVNTLLAKGTPAYLDIACLVSAPEGVAYLNQNISIPFQLWTCAMDDHLNDHYYIVPGLGDAGDLAFGKKA